MHKDLKLLLRLEGMMLRREMLAGSGPSLAQPNLASRESDLKTDELRSQVSGTVLDQFDKLATECANPIAMVACNTCRGCRQSVPSSLARALSQSRSLLHCPHCGRFLLAEEKVPELSPPLRARLCT